MRQGIALIGFGEAGRTFAAGWGSGAAPDLRACDLRAAEPGLQEAARAAGITCHSHPGPALAGAAVAFCLVTADQALAAARAAADVLPAGLLWLDGNSCAPGTKRRAAAVIEAVGGHYVDLAVMAPVAVRGHRTPCLLAGPQAVAAAEALAPLGMDLRVVGSRVGDASAIKMLRSVMIKGFEALTAECLLAARRAGVEGEVLASLQASDPGWNWQARGAYNLERMLAHGTRRAAEMREVVRTLADLGLPARMSAAAAEWQDQLAALHVAPGPDDLASRADRILAALPAGDAEGSASAAQ